MRELSSLSPAELAALQPGEKLVSIAKRAKHFEVLHPSHATVSRINDEAIVQLFIMEMPPVGQIFEVVNVDPNGNPTIVTSGTTGQPPAQVEIGQIRADAGTMAQLGALMIKQAIEMDKALATVEIEKQYPDLKDVL